MKTKKMVAGGIVGALFLLIFLSGTIYNFNTPSVTAVRPAWGYLNYMELTSGVVRYAETVEMYAHLPGWVGAVLVREGDVVAQGQPLIAMDFRGNDTDMQENIIAANIEFQEQLDTLQINRARTQLDIERITANIHNIRSQITDLTNDSLRQDAVSDFEIQRSQREIDTATAYLEQIQVLYDGGVATRQELTNATNSLESVLQNHDNLLSVYEENQERLGNQLADWEVSRERQLRDLNSQIETLERDRRARSLDMDAFGLQEESLHREFENRIADYEDWLEDFSGNAVITSPVHGIVTTLPISQGQHISANQLLGSVGVVDIEEADWPFVVEAEIPLSNNFITVGSMALLYNANHTLEGMVTQVVPLDNAKRLTIAIQSTLVAAGETFTIQFEETSSNSFILVPNGAINRDSEGYFLNQVRRRRGILGEEFFTERVGIHIGDSDNNHTAVIRGITFFEPVVHLSDRPFSTGETVQLRNESDFFGD